MSKLGWRQFVAGLGLAVAGLLPAAARAQGVTTGGFTGTVTDANGAPVEAAQVEVINRGTGFRTGTITRDNGRYTVLGLETGGPYTLTVRRIGFEQATRENLYVPLTQVVRVDVQLAQATVTLSNVRVTADANAALINGTRTGVATSVSDSALRRLPTLNRNFTDFVVLTPQVAATDASNGQIPRISALGTNNRYNQVQIDGAGETDLFGLGATGQPGGQARGKSIALESVKEYQVLLAPYDVRQGNFTGALVNAVTKNGTNTFSGNAYWINRNQSFARDQAYIPEFSQSQYGVTLGGPIIKDRVHFFVNPEFQKRDDPATGGYLGGAGASAVPVEQQYIDRFQRILADSFGLQSGGLGQITNNNPLTNLFARLDFQLPWNSRAVLRHNYGGAALDVFSRDNGTANNGIYRLTSNGYEISSKKNATVGQLFTNWTSGMANEIIVGYTTVRDKRETPQDAPQITVTVPKIGGGTARLRAGTDDASHRNTLDQDIFEITDNFTLPLGDAHRLTIGGRLETYKVANLFGQRLFGEYTFGSTCTTAQGPACNLDALAAGNPQQYQVGITFPDDPNDGVARFRAASYAAYVQDQWTATDRLNISAGIRVDVPSFRDKPPFNSNVSTTLGRNTSDVPSGNAQIAPRVGFNWDVTGNQRNQLRGGAGVFVGRPAYVWLGNAFQNSGVSGVGQITCNQASQGIPKLTRTRVQDLSTVPQRCDSVALAPAPDVNLLSSDLKYPQTFRTSLGFDRRVGDNWIFTVEGIYNRFLNALFFNNINRQVRTLAGTAPEYAGRVLYADTIRGTGASVPYNVSGNRSIIDLTNQSKDYSYALTGQIQRKFQKRFEGSLAYTYTQARDVQSYSSSVATSNFRQGRAVSGSLSDQSLGRSKFEQPHRIVASGTYALPTKTDLSVIWIGQSGQAYDYIYGGSGTVGDLNGDGSVGNDLIYVPKSAYDTTQIRFSATGQTAVEQAAALERFIQNEPCLREQRGHIMSRNTCRSPWQNMINVSIRQSVPTLSGQNLSLELGIFNFANLLNSRWGRQPFINNTGSSSITLLTQTGMASAQALNAGNLKARPTFSFTPTQKRFDVNNLESNYQLQFSVRYSF